MGPVDVSEPRVGQSEVCDRVGRVLGEGLSGWIPCLAEANRAVEQHTRQATIEVRRRAALRSRSINVGGGCSWPGSVMDPAMSVRWTLVGEGALINNNVPTRSLLRNEGDLDALFLHTRIQQAEVGMIDSVRLFDVFVKWLPNGI